MLTLDTSTATKSFDEVRTILGQTHGVTGVPLLYVIRVTLVPPEDDDDDPAFGDEDSKYISIDKEMIACTPILSDDADIGDEDTSDLEANGLFVPTFPVDSKKVWVPPGMLWPLKCVAIHQEIHKPAEWMPGVAHPP